MAGTRSRDRTFTGCWTCRSRKVKCDENKPTCRSCLRMGLKCTGYASKLIWVYDDNLPSQSTGRRYMKCESVWDNLPVLHSDIVDYLIAQCDSETDDSNRSSGIMSTTALRSKHNPFSFFHSQKLSTSPGISASLSSPGSIELISDDLDEKRLFHHYINHVAFIMMPFEHMRNPWKSSYPAVAMIDSTTNRNALYNALLAHSASNLAQLGVQKDKMERLTTKYYTRAIGQLRTCIADDNSHYAFIVAVIMTVMMVEIYSGNSQTWRHHLKGAWSFLCQTQQSAPWLESDFACVSTQSLHIITIITGTTGFGEKSISDGLSTLHDETDTSVLDGMLTTSIMSTADFGFTIGGSKTILDCISRISKLAEQRENGIASPSYDLELTTILSYLQEADPILDCSATQDEVSYSSGGPSHPFTLTDVAYHQHKAFVLATYIYLFRVIFDSPPQDLTIYVNETFKHISAFSKANSGNFSLWPAFIAAAEACTPEDKDLANDWMNNAGSFGLGNRILVKRVIDEIWTRRELLSEQSGLDQSCIRIDWREVMHDLDLDVLLI